MRNVMLTVYLVLCFTAGNWHLVAAAEAEDGRAPLGTREWPPVTNGVVFTDGEFMPAPYVVTSVEGDIFINGTHVMTALKWPPRIKTKREPPSALPTLPPTITELSTPYDKACKEYIGHACWFLTAKYGHEEGIKKLVKVYAQMPCVKHAQISEENSRAISVTWKTGETINVVHGEEVQLPVVTRDQAFRYVESMAQIFVDNLKDNHYFVLGRGMRMGTYGGFIQIFTPLAGAMRSARSENEFLAIMQTNQPPGGMSDAALRLFYQHKEDLPKWDPRRPVLELQ